MTTQGTKKIVLTGTAGPLAGAVVPNLLALDHSVRIVTDHLETVKEKKKGENVEVIQGDLRKRKDLLKAIDGMDGVFIGGARHEDGPDAELAQGKAIIDACVEKNMGHVVYSSVCCANKRTGVPHFEARHEVEEHLKNSGLPYTILRPVWFMENFISSRYRPSIEKGVLSTPLRPDRMLQMVSVHDVGRIVAEVFMKPGKFGEREIDIAGDQLTMDEIAGEISRVTPKPVRYERLPDSDAGKTLSKDMLLMFRWLDKHGYDVDLWMAKNQFRRFEIPLASFRECIDKYRPEFRQAA
jgi:uncharacterized protein YbjT (DUF2867 family)